MHENSHGKEAETPYYVLAATYSIYCSCIVAEEGMNPRKASHEGKPVTRTARQGRLSCDCWCKEASTLRSGEAPLVIAGQVTAAAGEEHGMNHAPYQAGQQTRRIDVTAAGYYGMSYRGHRGLVG